ncbi:hypothetical protein ASPWEDRAFT_104603 [Aspergillus wentii DTO 134E9]|uniref:RBR-type E3 ubiquitin transferase n=1 Tax=Aspergillus wentii DTO 134E9 TaxID=1073089 RepID=A0A1L9RT73_ASPWE|nr:uncharacterized protein ASPWEDRAFT_104603 [Aspergillus wentii DTO 134E9]OJJ38132.1 hypothetical protein ASPWEDRAFT_104603 [Aspergillus wentii DTO 134E9]
MEEYDLLIIADATASMMSYLESLNTSLPQIISISALTGCFSRIGLLGYRDYSDESLLEWSGWLNQNQHNPSQQQPDLVANARGLKPYGGGDYPEAVKTALAKACEVMRSDAKTVILLYTDAPPHTKISSGWNAFREKIELLESDSYGGFGPAFADWVSASHALRSGEKQAQVFTILESSMSKKYAAYYNFLSALTGGSCLSLHNSCPEAISKVTVDLLLAWMGVEKAPVLGDKKVQALPTELSRYISGHGIKQVRDERDQTGRRFFPGNESVACVNNITRTEMTADIMKKHLPKKSTPVPDFAKRWYTDAEYKETAVTHLMDMFHHDVRAIALNPVFGSLWRAVCSDRNYPRRDEIVTAFDQHIDKISDSKDKADMKAWLEESYEHTAEVLSIIDNVPEAERFPCVFLDPTLNFSQSNADSNNDESSLSELTRAELLEIGRSCNPSILRRLGRILTRLIFVNSANEMPQHIAMASSAQVTRIPLALAAEKHNRQFWKVLFHTIVPGTRLSSRPAALVAALSLRLGMTPLADAAEQEMLSFKDKWNDVEIPENWTVGCLALLLDANEAHRKQRGQDVVAEKPTSLLRSSDSKLFEQLIAFKMLELNLDTPLTARIPWTPNKAISNIGPLVTCRSCRFPRSVTIMGNSGKCGICLATDHASSEDKENHKRVRVSQDVTTVSEATWVECSDTSCRAQYVLYNIDRLKVRAKCHYCRTQSQIADAKQNKNLAPVVECKQCFNRMIWPKAYRPSSFVESEFVCPPCVSGRDPTTEIEMTARKISAENTLSWLIRDIQNPDIAPFTNRSLFQTVSTMGSDNFLSRIKLFPDCKTPLSHKRKPICNSAELISTLQEVVATRRTTQVDCSLCFSRFRPGSLHPACGRRGCLQNICTSCLAGWYGLNAPGKIINTAALACPFCRRLPTARTLSKYGMGIHAVKDLGNAVRDKGTWIYAWCQGCSTAKQYMERSCARGTPPENTNWTDEECVEERERLELERELQRLEQEATHQYRKKVEAAEARRLEKIKPCPRCGTMTEKTMGCGHIRCPVEKCGVDWCYFCGKQFGQARIYEHMRYEHGGIFDDDDGLIDD